MLAIQPRYSTLNKCSITSGCQRVTKKEPVDELFHAEKARFGSNLVLRHRRQPANFRQSYRTRERQLWDALLTVERRLRPAIRDFAGR
jgi:hypothetical protein